MSADLYFTRLSSTFIFRQLISELTERNSTIFGHMVGSKCNLKNACPQCGVPYPPTNRGPQNHFFGDFAT